MKRILLILGIFFAIAGDKDPKVEYINKYSGIAVSEMERSGVPASITLAQGILESRAGLSPLAVKGNNHFGIKCHSDWRGKVMRQDDDSRSECFRVYPNAEASFRDHSDFLRYQQRYKALFDLDGTDYKAWAQGLKKAGYATDPQYPAKLIKLIEDYELYRFDKGVVVEVEAPSVAEAPKEAGITHREEFRVNLSRQIFEQNKAAFVYAVEGETYSSIAKSYGLFKKEILRFNDVSGDHSFKGGEVVYISQKKNQAAKGIDKYIVGPEEEITLWQISQKYGVKLSSILKMNAFKADHILREGDTVRLRP